MQNQRGRAFWWLSVWWEFPLWPTPETDANPLSMPIPHRRRDARSEQAQSLGLCGAAVARFSRHRRTTRSQRAAKQASRQAADQGQRQVSLFSGRWTADRPPGTTRMVQDLRHERALLGIAPRLEWRYVSASAPAFLSGCLHRLDYLDSNSTAGGRLLAAGWPQGHRDGPDREQGEAALSLTRRSQYEWPAKAPLLSDLPTVV